MVDLNYTYIALVPSYQPTEILPKLAQSLKASGFLVIIVNDGSGDKYQQIFSACKENAVVLCYDLNMGKGHALKLGLNYINRHFAENTIIVTVDADGQHSVTDALSICDIAAKNPFTLILGSRKFKSNVPLRSQFGNTVTRAVYRLTTGLKVYDTQTGLRAFEKALIPKLLTISGERYEYEMNVLLTFAKEGIKIMEHEIETIYIDGNSQSHFDTVKDSARIYREILKFSASSFVGFLVDYAVYSLLLLLTSSLIASNIIARFISASVNFTVNKKFVFKSNENTFTPVIKYIMLAAAILTVNTLLLSVLVNNCGINRMFAKVMTEIILFFVSYFIQRLFVFKKEVIKKYIFKRE